MAELSQLIEATKASRADQKTIGQMMSGYLSGLSDDFKELKSSLKKGQKDDKKANDDQKRREQAKSEKDREFSAAFLKKIEKLGDSIESAFDNIGDVASPAGIGKILFGIVGFLAGTLTGFFTQIKSTLFMVFKIFAYPFQKLFPKTVARISSLFTKVFGKKGLISKFFGVVGRVIGKLGKFFKPVITFIKTALTPFFNILGKLSPTLKAFGGGGGGLMKFFKPLVSTFKTAFKVGKIFGKVVGKIFLPIQIIWGVVKGLLASLDKFKEGDILGGIGAFFGGILDVFTFGIIDIEKFTDWFKDLFGSFFDGFSKLFSGDIVGGITDIGNAILTWCIGLPELVFDGILNAIAGIFNFFGLDSIGNWFSQFAEVDILGTIKGFFASMMEYIGPVIDGIMDTAMLVFGAIGDVFSWIYDNVFIPYISTLGDIMTAVFGGIGDSLKWVYNNTINPVISGIMYFFEMVGYAFSQVQRVGMMVLNGLVNLVNRIPDWALPKSLEGLKPIEVPESPEFPTFEMLPGLQFGGLVEGMNDGLGKLFRMGEGGDELVTPLDQLKPSIIDPIMSKAMAMVPQMQQMAGGAMQAAGNALIVNAPNNSQMVNAPTTMMGAMTTRNADMSRRDMNC